jgi:hypothetical protein
MSFLIGIAIGVIGILVIEFFIIKNNPDLIDRIITKLQ